VLFTNAVIRIGRLPAGRRTKWLVLASWIIVIAVSFPLAGRLSTVEKNKATVEFPRGADSTYVQAVNDRFPDGQIATGLVAYVDDGGITTADRAKVAADRAAFMATAAGPVGEPVPAPDGKALLVVVPLRNNDRTLPADAARIRSQAQGDLPAGLMAELAGPAGNALDASDAQQRNATSVTAITILVIAVILLVTYRSLVLWLLPLLSVVAAFGVSQAVSYLLARYAGLAVDTGNAAVVTVLVFGVGTDYALLLLARYREELRRSADRHAAMTVALRRAGPAIVASGLTVSISLLCLLAATMGFNHVLGPTGAVGILCGLAAMVTLLPAMLVALGRWVFWPRIPRPGDARPTDASTWARVGAAIVRHPRMVWAGSVLVLGALALGALGMRTGLDNDHQFVGHPGSLVGQQALATHFHAGQSDPVKVVAAAGTADRVSAAIRGVAGVASVQPPKFSVDGTLARIDVVLDSPADSATASGTVRQIRAVVRTVPDADAHVGGNTALAMDKAAAQAHDRRVVIPLVLVVVFLVLALLLRALVGALLLMMTVVLSFFAALGVSWLLFVHAFGFPAVDVQLMLVGFLFLVALGVDYNIFLVSRIRQEASQRGHRSGVLTGLAVTGGVITSAGVVLAATFLALTRAPQVAFIEIGVLVAIGVLLDTFLVRSVLVPALALDVGHAFWWPGRLPRRSTVDEELPDAELVER
jgi:RND superfamily putative drug exporter